MEEIETASGILVRPSFGEKCLNKRRLTIKNIKQKTQPRQEWNNPLTIERVNTQPSTVTRKSSAIQRRRGLKRKSLIEEAAFGQSTAELKIPVSPSGKLKSTRSKEHNRKSIQLYSSQQFFKTCLNERTKQEQRAMYSQWKYLGKYGGEFQRMGLKALTNLAQKRSPRKVSTMKRPSSNFEQEVRQWTWANLPSA